MLEQDRRVLVYKFGASSRIYMMLCTGHPLAMPLHGHFSDSSRNQLKGLSYISASHMGTRATNEDLAVSSSMLNLAVDGVSRKVFCIPSGQNLASLHGQPARASSACRRALHCAAHTTNSQSYRGIGQPPRQQPGGGDGRACGGGGTNAARRGEKQQR